MGVTMMAFDFVVVEFFSGDVCATAFEPDTAVGTEDVSAFVLVSLGAVIVVRHVRGRRV